VHIFVQKEKMANEVNGLKLVRKWMTRAKDCGSSLTQICSELNVTRSLPERWKKSLPEVVEVYMKMEQAFDWDSFQIVAAYFDSIGSIQTYLSIEAKLAELESAELPA
jgi:hypothetical protein